MGSAVYPTPRHHCTRLPLLSTLSGTTALYTAPGESLPGSSIAFPVRLHRGLLQRTDEQESYLTLIAVMARTPRGSWPGHPLFGFNEFFKKIANESLTPEARKGITAATVQDVKIVLADLGLTRFQLESIAPDRLEHESQQNTFQRWSGHEMDRRGFTAILRESGARHIIEYAL